MASQTSALPDGSTLTKPAYTDSADIAVINTNMDKIVSNINAENQALSALNSKTAAKRYYNACTINSENVSWSWGGGYLQNVGDLVLLSTGITTTGASSDWLNIITVQSDYKPTYDVRGVATTDDGSETKIVRITTDGKIDIYKPNAKSYWFEIVWLKNISN